MLPFDFLRFLLPEPLLLFEHSLFLFYDALLLLALLTLQTFGLFTLGLLNKRNNVSQDLALKPGEQRRVGDVIVRLQACERTAPWEMPQDTGAFVQVLVRDKVKDEWKRVHSGWLFKNSPSLNVVEHPVYDVWVKDCAMSFPGEESAAPKPAPSAASTAPAPSPTASASASESTAQ